MLKNQSKGVSKPADLRVLWPDTAVLKIQFYVLFSTHLNSWKYYGYEYCEYKYYEYYEEVQVFSFLFWRKGLILLSHCG